MFCTNCGNEIKEGTLFCTNCGTPAPKVEDVPVVEPARKAEPTPQPTQPKQVPPTADTPAPQKKGNGLIIAIIVIIAALIIGIGAYVLVSNDIIDFGSIFASKDVDDEDDDDKEDLDDEESEDVDDSRGAEDGEATNSEDIDASDFYIFENADENFVLNSVLPVYGQLSVDMSKGITLFCYNEDIVPELYVHGEDVVYTFNKDQQAVPTDLDRATLLVYGFNVTSFVKSNTLEAAYDVLIGNVSNADYILPNSSTEYLTKADLAGLTKEELRIARNEIFARHGRMFDSEDLQAYFNSKEWYTGTIPADEFDLEAILNDIEKANADLIKEVEAEMGN